MRKERSAAPESCPMEAWLAAQDKEVEKVYRRMKRAGKLARKREPKLAKNATVTQKELSEYRCCQAALLAAARYASEVGFKITERIKNGAEIEDGPLVLKNHGLVEFR